MAKLYMMVGLSASGKSTYAQYIAEQENAVIHESCRWIPLNLFRGGKRLIPHPKSHLYPS